MKGAPNYEVTVPTHTLGQQVQCIVSAALEVHFHLGPGYLEAVYQEALALEFALRGVPYTREVHIPIAYKGQRLNFSFRADFICYSTIVVEIKAVLGLLRKDDPQLRGYLNATGKVHGLMINFGAPRLQFKRILHAFTTSG